MIDPGDAKPAVRIMQQPHLDRMPRKGKLKKGTAGGRSKKAGKEAAQPAKYDYFDKVYYKKGKVCIYPDIIIPKPKLYKEVTTRQVPSQAGGHTNVHPSRRQGTAKQNAKSHADKATRVVASEYQQQAQEKGESSAKKHPASSSAANTKGLARRENGQKGEERGENTIKEPKSYVLDEEKLKDENVQEQLRAEECECLVVRRIKAALEEAMGPDDPPVFILHNQNLTVMVEGKPRTKIEQDVLILHAALGVLLVRVKAIKSRTSFSRFDGGTEQLLRAKESVLEEMGDLLEEDAIILTMALPELQPEDSSVIRQRAQKLSSREQRQNITVDAPASADKTEKSGGARQGNEPKFKGTALLGDHPEIYLLCGSTAEVFREWVEWLRQQCPKSGHAFKGANDAERLDNFKRACMRRFSVPNPRPGQSAKDSADLHHRFLLTEEQLQARDSQADFLHINGPPGSGKTLLLAERARRWLREGCHIALVVGLPTLGLLLHHLYQSVGGEKVDDGRISKNKGVYDLLDAVKKSTEDRIFVIVDEASPVIEYVYGGRLDSETERRICGLWSADTQPLTDSQKKELQRLGGSTVQLSCCLRCPPHVITLTNIVKLEGDPPLHPPQVPATRELGVIVEVISHPDHPCSQSWDICPSCTQETRTFFASLGLQEKKSESALKLSDIVVITTVLSCDRRRVAKWLCSLGLPAVAEAEQDQITPPLPTGGPTGSQHQALEKARSRMLKGEDVKGKPVIHVVGCENFMGMEKPVVVLWHEDRHDKATDVKRENQRDDRLSWFMATTRCQGRLAVVAITPSPLLPKLSKQLCQRSLRPEAHRSHSVHRRASLVREGKSQPPPFSPSPLPPVAPASRTSGFRRLPPEVIPQRPPLPALPSRSISPRRDRSSRPFTIFPFHTLPQLQGTYPSHLKPETSSPTSPQGQAAPSTSGRSRSSRPSLQQRSRNDPQR